MKFYCVNCGSKVERNLMPWKHAVLGSIPSVNRNSSCCDKPDYRDSEGYYKGKSRKLVRRRVPRLYLISSFSSFFFAWRKGVRKPY